MATESVRGVRRPAVARRATDETKASFKTTEFYAAVVLVAAILIAAAVSDTLDDVRAWTLVTAVGIGYMLSRGLAKSGTKYTGGEDLLGGGDPIRRDD
jgi:hypothetical protein